MEEFKSTHNLMFMGAPFDYEPNLTKFKVGTCHGLFGASKDSYNIIAITNEEKGNGHLDDVFEWFENSCKRDNKKLMVVELLNMDFKEHLIKKRGFIEVDEKNVIKDIIK